MVEFDLLEKTELRIERISLHGANLNDVAVVVADVLGMAQEEVLVTDVQNNCMTIDLLRKTVDPYRVVGKKDMLFEKLSHLHGVEISEETSVCSQGMLGWIALDEAEAKMALKRSEKMVEEIRRKVAKRAIVFSTGEEVLGGQIEDTNKPVIIKRLEKEGYTVISGPILKDDAHYIAGQLRHIAETGGYGLIITTGGVGAEAKDHTIEALLALDPEAATPYICEFKPGTGRHVKKGVRIGVGQAFGALFVSLPGPNDEVRASLDIVANGLRSKQSKHSLAESLASNLRVKLREKMKSMAHEGYVHK